MRKYAHFLLPSILLIALFLPGVNQGALRTDSDIYAAVGLHAFRDGPLFPLMAGDEAYMNKPPLAIAVHGLFLHILGPSLFAARLPTLIAALIALVATIHATRTLAGRRAALFSGLVLATTIPFFRHTHAITLDIWLTACIMPGVAIVAHWLKREGASAASLAALGVPLGLALLVKPFIALLPLAIIGAWVIIAARGRRSAAVKGWLGAFIIALAIAAPWHAAMTLHFGRPFWDNYFGNQALARALTDSHGSAPWYFYAVELAETYWPWLPALVVALVWGVKRLRPGSFRALLPLLCVLFSVVWLLALSLSTDKVGRYLICIYPLFAMLIGAWGADALGPVLAHRVTRWAVRMVPVLGVIAIIAAMLPIKVHSLRSTYWADLASVLDVQPAAVLWVPPGNTEIGANIYLDRSVWPRTTSYAEELIGQVPRLKLLASRGATADPAIGDIILLRPNADLAPRETDEVIFNDKRLIAVRVTTPWDGQYRVSSK